MGDNVVGNRFSSMNLDAGRTPEKKTKWTASACAHIITALIGSGVLSLPWAMAQLGWIAGLTVMLLSSLVTFATFSLLAACYSSSNPPNGKRNCTYMDADPDILGTCKFKIFQLLYYVNLSGVAIGYTIEAAKSMNAIRKLKCFDIGGEKNPWLVITFGLIQIILSEIYDTISLVRFISIIVTAVMSFIYSVIGLFLSIARVAKTGKVGGTLTGTTGGISTQKTWRMFQALGDIAFAYSYSIILSESHDIIKSPQSEVKTMIKALLISVGVTTLFYLLCGCFGYAAFGDLSPENLLTGLGFHDPYWLLDIANIAIVIHLAGAYQVYCQPLFEYIEEQAPDRIINRLFRLLYRTLYVIVITLISIFLPLNFSDMVGLLGALGFWPFTVYFPIETYIKKKQIQKWTKIWIALKILSSACLVITIAAAAGSIAGIVPHFKS